MAQKQADTQRRLDRMSSLGVRFFLPYLVVSKFGPFSMEILKYDMVYTYAYVYAFVYVYV